MKVRKVNIGSKRKNVQPEINSKLINEDIYNNIYYIYYRL